MLNEIKFKDKLGRKWEIDFPEYIWKIYKGTNPEYIIERLIEVCSDIDECEEYIVNHDTIIAYGIYLTMIQINYEDRFINIATADYINRKSEKISYLHTMQIAGINVREFRETKHTIKELEVIAGCIAESKEPYYSNYYNIPIENYNGDGFITYNDCFRHTNIVALKNMFQLMMANFKWSDIANIIYKHSIYGIAFYNAVERVAIRGDEIIYHIPDGNIILEEFEKLLIKYEYRGFSIDPNIKKYYIKRR